MVLSVTLLVASAHVKLMMVVSALQAGLGMNVLCLVMIAHGDLTVRTCACVTMESAIGSVCQITILKFCNITTVIIPNNTRNNLNLQSLKQPCQLKHGTVGAVI